MTPIAKSEAFFFISSISVIVLALITAIVLAYVIRILRDVKAITAILRNESQRITEDFHELRIKLRKEFGWNIIYRYLKNFWKRKKVGRNA